MTLTSPLLPFRVRKGLVRDMVAVKDDAGRRRAFSHHLHPQQSYHFRGGDRKAGEETRQPQTGKFYERAGKTLIQASGIERRRASDAAQRRAAVVWCGVEPKLEAALTGRR